MSIQVDSYIQSLASMVSQMTGLNRDVILAQWHAEEGVSSVNQWFSNNPAGITHGNSKVDAYSIGVNKSGFDVFPDAQTGAKAYATLINTDPSYVGVRASAGKSSAEQLQAIIASPWEENHYNKPEGNLLLSSYNSITGASIKQTDGLTSSTQGIQGIQTNTSIGTGVSMDTIINTVKFDGIYFILALFLLLSMFMTFKE